MNRLLPFVLCMAVPLISGCGMQSVYSGGSQGAVARTISQTRVDPIDGQGGWLVRNALRDRIGASTGDARYRLVVRLDDSITGFGVRSDDTVTRERRTLRARYQLVDNATGETLIDDTASSDAGIDVVGSEYATIAAEKSALERLSGRLADMIIARIARYAGDGQPESAP